MQEATTNVPSMPPEMLALLDDPAAAEGNARDRILAAAYDLFSRQGIQAVGIDAVVARAGVARMTLYRHFQSKEELVLAFLEQREELWTKAWLQAEVARRASDPREQLLAIFDVFDGWFRGAGFEGCSFINVLLESADATSPIGEASASYLARIRSFLAELAAEAGVGDPEGFARKWHVLMKGSIVSAAEGDEDAAMRAREIGDLLLRDTLEAKG
jgi:AcrR family transcriptional regulator